jgi:hypothetical protein
VHKAYGRVLDGFGSSVLYPVGEARVRVLHLLERARDAMPLEQLLPDGELGPRVGGEAGAGAPVPAPAQPRGALRRRSAWSSTFAACLELARQGQVRLKQEGDGFAPTILVRPSRIASEDAAQAGRLSPAEPEARRSGHR